MIRIVLLWIALLCTPLHAENLPALYSVTGVAANDVLNLRERPDSSAAIVGRLAPDASGVEVVAFADDWAVINVDGVAAYAARRFLSREDGPDWVTLQRPILCAGTEPFWTLAVDPSTASAGFSTPEQPEPRLLAIDDLWPGNAWTTSAAVSLPVGLAVLRQAECSDGMSDQQFGIAVDLFLRDAGGLRLAGCCSLSQD